MAAPLTWWVGPGSTSGSAVFRKSATSPGSGWEQVKGSTASMTQAQATQLWVNDIANGDYGSSPLNGVKKIASAAGISDPLDDFLGAITSSGTWIRVAKVIIGGVLVIVGVAQLTGVGSEAATVATAAAKSVPGVGQAVGAAKSARSTLKKKAGS